MILEFITGFIQIIGYFVLCASGALFLRYFVPVPREVFRKLLHIIVLCSLPVFIFRFQTWWIAALSALVFMVVVYPVLFLVERIPGFSELLIERKNGEIKNSLLLVFSMFATMITVGWGWFDERWLVLACVYAWGFGDAAAALVGKKFGKHHLKGRFIDERKTLEGTLAMFATSFLSVLLILFVGGNIVWYGNIVIALVTAIVCAVVELHSWNGLDTITCPFAAAAVILPLVFLWGI